MSVANPPHQLPPATAAALPDEPAWEIAELFPYKGQWSEDDYFALNATRLVELSDGSIEVPPMPTRLHQAIVILMCNLLRAVVAADPAAVVLFAPFAVRLWPGKMRQPDVLYMSGANAHRAHEDHWEGADLVVEVVSGDDPDRDWAVKHREYARARIPEYWIIDPRPRTVTVLRLAGDRYEVAGTYRPGDTAASVLLPTMTVAVTDIFNAR